MLLEINVYGGDNDVQKYTASSASFDQRITYCGVNLQHTACIRIQTHTVVYILLCDVWSECLSKQKTLKNNTILLSCIIVIE